jgi:transposase InsO family protein
MLTETELAAWYQRLNISEPTRALINRVRRSDPTRRVGGGRSNVSGLYPSRKMGVTIQFESHRVELAAIYDMEHDPETLEFYDQPYAIALDYQSARGRRQVVRHTPDFFVIRQDAAGWEEWKTEDELNRLAQHSPNRYRREADCWHCPPGEGHASQFGLYYRLRSSKEIDWRFQRNALFLEDYMRFHSEGVARALAERIVAHASALLGISLAALIERVGTFATRDDVYSLIATGHLYVDLHVGLLVEPATVRVFPDRDSSVQHVVEQGAQHSSLQPRFQTLRAGAMVTWDGRAWQVANIGSTTVAMLGEDGRLLELPAASLESLIREGRLTQSATDAKLDTCQNISNQLLHASEEDLRVANHRAIVVRQRLSGENPAEVGVPARTMRRWIARYHAAESQFGAGYIGLLPRIGHRGNLTRRLGEIPLRLMNEVIDKDYETVTQKSRIASWATLNETCKREGVPTPSYTTFCHAVRNQNRIKQTLKRQGPRAAYQHGPFYVELDLKTPRHGDRPFEICHADHTQLDIELTDSTGKHVLGRPWMTLMIDAFSRRILAVHIDFEEPSYRACMMVLRECVRRHSRLPQCLVVDWGPEFCSTYFEALLARYECIKKARPPAKARFGSLVERMFGTTNTQFLHNLLGNTQITRNVRQVTKSVNPKELAVWPLSPFMEQLCRYLYDIYDTNVHPALGVSPKEAYDRGFQNTGSRFQRLVRYDHDFMIATMPTTLKGTALVQPGRGVKINYISYWCDAMEDPKVQRKRVPVRFDPFDLGTAYAFIGGQWAQCHSDHFPVFQGRSQKELLVVSKELHAQNRDRSPQYQITASKLARAFQSVSMEESMLVQRLRARESQAARQQANHCDSLEGQVREAPVEMRSATVAEAINPDAQTFDRF